MLSCPSPPWDQSKESGLCGQQAECRLHAKQGFPQVELRTRFGRRNSVSALLGRLQGRGSPSAPARVWEEETCGPQTLGWTLTSSAQNFTCIGMINIASAPGDRKLLKARLVYLAYPFVLMSSYSRSVPTKKCECMNE